jgi:hypothetical protein
MAISGSTGEGGLRLVISEDDAATWNDALFIGKSTNVGIGTTTPSRKLEVIGNTLLNDLQVGRYGGALSGNTNPFVVNSYETSDLIFFGSSGATLNLRVYDGDLKFGSASSPSTYIQNNGTAVFAGSVTAASFPTSSDRRLKENISKLTTNDLRLVTGFQYNLKSDGSFHYGVIAQEVEKIFPHMVSTDDQGMKSVAYNEFIPLLIEAYKELQKELQEKDKSLNSLQREVSGMKSQNEDLYARLEKLEKILLNAKK